MSTKPDKKTPAEAIADVTTPMFNGEIGSRLKLVRMKLLLDQAEFGERLGIGQGAVSRLETGKVTVLERPFTTTKFREVVGTHFMFVMFGTNPERYSVGHINKAYWDHKNAAKGNRTERPIWASLRASRGES
jgi:DNA-binding XRE family transcriptional regulator